MDEFLTAATKELHTGVLHPRPDGPFHLFRVLQVSMKVFLNFLAKDGSRVAPSLDCRQGAVRLRDPSSELPPWRFARCEAQRCQVAAKRSCSSEPFLFWSVAVWNSSVDGSPALKDITAITPSASLKAAAMTFPAPV